MKLVRVAIDIGEISTKIGLVDVNQHLIVPVSKPTYDKSPAVEVFASIG